MAALAGFLQPPVVVRPRSEKSNDQHDRNSPWIHSQGAPGEEQIGNLHGDLHHKHGNKRHAERRLEGIGKAHLPTGQDKGLQHDAGNQAIDQGQDEKQVVKRRAHGDHGTHAVQGVGGKGRELADRATYETPRRVTRRSPPILLVSPIHRISSSCTLEMIACRGNLGLEEYARES